jgi:hypothetical protein
MTLLTMTILNMGDITNNDIAYNLFYLHKIKNTHVMSHLSMLKVKLLYVQSL